MNLEVVALSEVVRLFTFAIQPSDPAKLGTLTAKGHTNPPCFLLSDSISFSSKTVCFSKSSFRAGAGEEGPCWEPVGSAERHHWLKGSHVTASALELLSRTWIPEFSSGGLHSKNKFLILNFPKSASLAVCSAIVHYWNNPSLFLHCAGFLLFVLLLVIFLLLQGESRDACSIYRGQGNMYKSLAVSRIVASFASFSSTYEC